MGNQGILVKGLSNMNYGPKPYKVFIYDGKKTRKVAELSNEAQFQRKMNSYAIIPRSVTIYVTICGEWHKVIFEQADSKNYPGWKLVASEGVTA